MWLYPYNIYPFHGTFINEKYKLQAKHVKHIAATANKPCAVYL